MAGNKKPAKKYNSNKLKTNTPISIRYTEQEANKLKLPPLFSLMEFKTGKGVPAGRKTLEFRLHVGKELCLKHFQQSLVSDLDKAIAIVQGIKVDEATIHLVDCEFIGLLLVAIDEMQDMTTRRDQLDVYRKVATYCKD